MRILLLIGFLRGYRLMQRLCERGESVVGAVVYPEDVHEPQCFADDIEAIGRRHEIPMMRTRRLTDEYVAQIEQQIRPDVIFCSGWRMMLPPRLLTAAPQGVMAAHDSLLPRLRGFAPTNWALILGHDRVGVSLFRISEGMDEGEVYFQASHPVAEHDTFSTIADRQADLSVELFQRYLDAALQGKLQPAPQDHHRATYTCSRRPEDGEIDWSAPTTNIQRLVRALGPPAPYAFTFYEGKRLMIVRAHAVRNPANYEGRIPGRVIARDSAEGTVDVLTGDGVLRIETVSCDGQQAVSASHVITSVRKSLGLHVASEIGRLENQIQQLEQRILDLEEARATAGRAA